ncbi:MAG TPA: ATPase, T2SS/T4P/T4SS family, partial [bacterium]|nr:ATPase, T2SS/T4P/T4SS family [bacterium]
MKKRLGEMLVDEGIITEEQLQEALHEQKIKGGRLEKILISQGYVTQDVIMAFVGTQLGIPHVSLAEIGSIPNDVVFSVPESIAINHVLIPIVRKDKKLTVAMADPLNVFAIDDIKMMTGFEVEPAIAGEAEIKAMQAKYYGSAAAGGAGEAGADMQEIIGSMGGDSNLEVMEEKQEEIDISKLEAAGEDAPVVRLVNLILTEAVRSGASDIHIEPYEKSLRCRYRIDGVLHEVQSPPKSISAAMSSRIKIMSSLDIAERRLPQDGRIMLRVQGK